MTNEAERVERVARMEAHRRYESLPQVNSFIAGALWRSGIEASEVTTPPVTTGDLVIDVQNQSVTKAGARLLLTYKEGQLLCALARRGGDLVQTEVLMQEVWGDKYHKGEVSFVRMLMAALRSKIGREYVITAWGAGYRLAMFPPTPSP